MPTQIALQPGQIIDRRYTILEQLGHGGFGRTYLATDNRRHNERCVLKEFAPLMTAQPQAVDKARELFRREAAVLHQLRHPQIPEFREEFEIYDRGQARWILVQEWIEGETYLDLLQSGPFLEVQVIQFLQDFLPILDYLHQHHPPVIHRDIALDNILLNSATNRPTLIDFGTVKQAINPVSRAASQSTFIAKQGYSPPEQALGNAYPSSDLYALGVCAIALLTGQRSPAVLYDAHQDQWHWQSYLPDGAVSPAFASFLNQLLQAQPRHRYESAAAALAALNTLHHQGTSAEPPTRLQRLTQRLTRPMGNPTGMKSPGQTVVNFPGDRAARSSLPTALQQALSLPAPSQSHGQNWSQGQSREQGSRATTQRTVAVGRPSGRTVLAPGATQRSSNTPETTQYIWPIWARPLLFAQPLLALLAFRVGPALLVLFLLYGGARQATRMVVAKVSTLPQPSLRRSPSQTAPNESAPAPSAESTDIEETASEPAADTTEKSDPIVSLPTIKLPEITLPKPPSIQFPTIQLPTIQLPKVEFPKIGFGQGNPVKSCRKKAIARFQKLPPEQASWAQVDEQFATRHPNHPTPLEPENPDHSTYIQDWCTIAHDWLDQAESP